MNVDIGLDIIIPPERQSVIMQEMLTVSLFRGSESDPLSLLTVGS